MRIRRAIDEPSESRRKKGRAQRPRHLSDRNYRTRTATAVATSLKRYRTDRPTRTQGMGLSRPGRRHDLTVHLETPSKPATSRSDIKSSTAFGLLGIGASGEMRCTESRVTTTATHRNTP